MDFSKKPVFGKKKHTNLTKEFRDGIDDISDDENPDRKRKDQPKDEGSAPANAPSVGFSVAAARPAGYKKNTEEENKGEPRKPKFTGRVRLGGDNRDEDTGPKHDYDFKVAFRRTGP